MNKTISRITASLKAALTRIKHPGQSWGLWLTDHPRKPWMDTVPGNNSIVQACIRWVQSTYPEAPLMLQQRQGKDWEDVHEDAFLSLMEQPNPFYDGITMKKALIADRMISGNAYMLKFWSARSLVSQLVWAPSFMIEPKWPDDGFTFIDHYDYTPLGIPIRLEPSQVVHLRDGLDPTNTRKGLSPIASLLREIYSDDEAAAMTAALLRNMGVPGVVISPEGEDPNVSDDDVAAWKEKYDQLFTGDKRGGALVVGKPTKIQQFGSPMKDMDLSKIRNIPEERISAVLGIPAAVVGLGSGLEQTKVGATMRELRELAYESHIIPLQRDISSQLKTQLLIDFKGLDVVNWRVAHDLTQVRVLQEDQNALATRISGLVTNAILTIGEGRQELGFDAEPEHEVYLVPSNVTRVVAGELNVIPEPVAPVEEVGEDGEEDPMKLPALSLNTRLKAIGPKGALREQRLMLALRRDRERMEAALAVRASDVFAELGDRAASAFLQDPPPFLDLLATQKGYGVKQSLDEEDLVAGIITRMGLDKFQMARLRPMYEAHYLLSAQTTYGTIKASLGIDLAMEDHVAREIIAEGGRRAGLIDLTMDTRKGLFRALEEGRARGEGVAALSRRIRDTVPAGRWKDVRTRAEIIAQTETAHSQRLSSLSGYRASGVVKQVEILDAQLRDTDAVCEARAGQIVSMEEAEGMVREEHPRGTLELVPIVEE